LGAVLALATADAIFLGGTCLAQISSFWPPFKRRILVHEAGHLLTAYLMGCPIRGVILDPFVALRMGIQGQAGTQFWDEKMEKELAEGHLSSTVFDRNANILVLFWDKCCFYEEKCKYTSNTLYRCTHLLPCAVLGQSLHKPFCMRHSVHYVFFFNFYFLPSNADGFAEKGWCS